MLKLHIDKRIIPSTPSRKGATFSFETRQVPRTASDRVYELYRKLDALHLFSGSKPQNRTFRTDHRKCKRRKHPGHEETIRRAFACETQENNGTGRVKCSKVRHKHAYQNKALIALPKADTKSNSLLLTLPPEIRCHIYEYLLVCGKVFPYQNFEAAENTKFENKEAQEHPSPNTSITKVSRLIRKESEAVLYSKNTLVLPSRRWTQMLFVKCLHNESRRSLIRSIYISFSHRDAYLRKDFRKNKKLRDRSEELRLKIKTQYPLRQFPSQSIKDQCIRQYREAIIVQNITDIAWLDKAICVLDNLQLDDMTVRFASAVRPYNSPDDLRLAAQSIRTFRAGFAFRLPTRMTFEGLDDVKSGSDLDLQSGWISGQRGFARQLVAHWTVLREFKDSRTMDL